MEKYTIREIADELGVMPQQINNKLKKKGFPKECITKSTNSQGREVVAVTGEGIQFLKDEFSVSDKTVNAEDKVLLGQLRLVKQGEFLGTTCDFYQDEQNNIYMTREQICKALEYSDEVQVRKLHFNNKELLDSLSVEISRFNTCTLQGYDLLDVDSKPLSNLQPNTLLYNEDGIYEITFLSRQPKANEFRAWVRDRIKEIRKFGFTTTTDRNGHHDFTPMINMMFGEGESIGKMAFTQAIARIEDLLEDNERQKDIITQQKETLDEQRPVYEFGERILISEDYAPVGTIANMLSNNGVDIGANRLRKWLRKKGVITMEWNGYQNQYRASQQAINGGLAITEQKPFTRNGFNGTTVKPLFTPKGQEWIIRKFFEEKEGGNDTWN